MKLRFEVDQAEAFRAGIDCPKSIVTVEVNPAEIPESDRNLIADRLSGIDVCQLWNSDKGTEKQFDTLVTLETGKPATPVRIVAKAPTFEALMDGIRENEQEVKTRSERHREIAMATAAAGIDTHAILEKHLADKQKVGSLKKAK